MSTFNPLNFETDKTGEERFPADLDSEKALKQVMEVSGCNEQEVLKCVRGRGGNPVRALAAWWMVVGAGVPRSDAGEKLQMTAAAVSRAIRRVKTEGIRKPYSDVVKWASILKHQRENDTISNFVDLNRRHGVL
jgi:hypothetical protein